MAAAPDLTRLTEEQLELFTRLDDQHYRLNHLYKITTKQGKVVPFVMNWEQEQLFREMHYLNLILKCRQIGGSTFIDIYSLDSGHFNDNQEFLLSAHKLEDGKKIFDTKILFPFNSMPDGIRQRAEVESKTELVLENGSGYRVSTSGRSGTLHKLHISEFGYTCRFNPSKAEEIVTGTLNAVAQGQIVWIESTAYGRIGTFYEYCTEALLTARMMRRLTSMEWRIFFFPWWAHPEYCMSEEETKLVVITAENEAYFEELAAKHGIELEDRQKAWYVETWKKHGRSREKMGREYPSYPEEAFMVSAEGAYYGKEMLAAYSDGRVMDSIPFDHRARVHTAWDIGFDDFTSIWFFQVFGPWIHVIDYYQNQHEGLPHYVRILEQRAEKGGWLYGRHFGPHDIEAHEWIPGAKRLESAKKLGINFTTIPRIRYDIDGVEAVRGILPRCKFDKARADEGILCLENFRKPWDEKNQMWGDGYVHDKYCHGAKAFESLAFGQELGTDESSISPEQAEALQRKYGPPNSRAV